jgi:hypothetical protein
MTIKQRKKLKALKRKGITPICRWRAQRRNGKLGWQVPLDARLPPRPPA